MAVERTIGNILIVDDAKDNLRFLELVLNEHGHQIRIADHGQAAISEVQAKLPDLVLLDVKLPDMNGYDVCRRIKAAGASKDIPIIFLSALSTSDDKLKGFEAGGVDYITKPFQPEEVIIRVETHLKLTRMRLQIEQQTIELRQNEQRWRTLATATFEGIAISEDGRFIDVNEQLAKMLDYKTAEMIGKEISLFVPHEDIEKVMDNIKAGREKILEHVMLRKDGSRVTVESHGQTIRSGEHHLRFTAIRDITVHKMTDEILKEREQRYRAIFNTAFQFTGLLNPSGTLIEANQTSLDFAGVSVTDVVGIHYWDTHWWKGDETRVKNLQNAIARAASGEFVRYEVVLQGAGDKTAVIDFSIKPIVDLSGKVILLIPEGRDMTDHKKIEDALAKERNLLRTLIDNLPSSIYVKDTAGRKILTNRADLVLIGADSEQQVLGKTDAEVFPKNLSEQFDRDDRAVLKDGVSIINREELIEDSAGVKRWVLTSKIPLKNDHGAISGLVGIGRDITEHKMMQTKLLTMAHYDTLTGLPNRTLFLEKAKMSIAHAKRAGRQCAVLFVDLDHFKSVNDTLGHSVGDELLKDTAVKLASCIRETDVMARLGGDEFIILLTDLDDAQWAQHTAERVREQLNIPRIVAGNDLFITASIGIATFPNDGETLEELLKNADTAMYAAKEIGRNAYCFFNFVMNKNAVTKMQVERGLRDALTKNEFLLYYQPIVEVNGGKIRGFEALLRWFKSEGGLVFPDEFIPVAEETGLIIPIGEWALHEACRFNKRLVDAGHKDLVISVNISVAQLRRKNIIDTIKSALDQSGLAPNLLEIEITESLLIKSFEAAIDILNTIRSLGVRISLDDFGTGYSSLGHLQRLPIVCIKIDRLFIKEIAKESGQDAMIPAIIDLAHKLKLSVVAEGVETPLQLEKLHANNCDFFQGYLLSKPVPESQIFSFLGKSPL